MQSTWSGQSEVQSASARFRDVHFARFSLIFAPEDGCPSLWKPWACRRLDVSGSAVSRL